MSRSFPSPKNALASGLFAVALTFATSQLHAADPPTSGTTVAPKPASSPTPTAVPRKSTGGSAKPFLVGGLDGTGIRRAAPVGPKAAAAAASAKKARPQSTAASAKKPRASNVKPFLGGGIDGTGIRKAAPVGPKAAATAASAKQDGT